MQKYTIRDLERDFPTEESCMDWLVDFLYPDGITCPKCEQITKHHRVVSRTSYSCDRCGHHEHPMAGTIFQDTRTPLRSWFHAVYLMASTRCGISAKQLEREIGVTYKTAWRMFTQIRKLLEEDGNPLAGKVEVDETYVGGRPRYGKGQAPTRADGTRRMGRRPATHPTQKTTVIGAVERGGRIHAEVVPSGAPLNALPMISARILPTAVVYTDEAPLYKRLGKAGYQHHRINHGARIYVKGHVHTQTIEGFWSLLKNGIRGSHHAVSAKYLQTYVNEYTFRYNHRDDDAPMFLTILGQLSKA